MQSPAYDPVQLLRCSEKKVAREDVVTHFPTVHYMSDIYLSLLSYPLAHLMSPRLAPVDSESSITTFPICQLSSTLPSGVQPSPVQSSWQQLSKKIRCQKVKLK